ncbi:exopolyphosphatase [Pseudactinotalea sp. HY158]|uniref:Ppx/GppA phosphatase family protein n=1 Tax=Pseudactinotalea sp. HY158 TaxID=2654547 RepID=UPI00129C92D5|nr:exopolyphosphatase [Pseudactinotalea sp. HY158]QGH68667.1 exopolyphosphatase [Pseudactinotalea sp. HY158]
MTRVAAIDCGTNSIRLLIADHDGGRLRDVVRLMRVVRLGQGVDRTGEFAPEALARTLEATADYARLCREHGVEAIRFVATSATRDARNRAEFIGGVTDRLGVAPEVISGTTEAELSFTGAARVIGPGTGSQPGPALVVDLGGGSTELVLGDAGGVLASWSMDVGCVRITERHLAGDPPTSGQVAAARADVRAAIAQAATAVPLDRVRTLVGLAGSVTTVTAHALGLTAYQPERINGARLGVLEIERACADLLHRTRAQRGDLGFMHPGRVDVIGAGALVWSEVVAAVAAHGHVHEATTSEHDILDGIALSLGG